MGVCTYTGFLDSVSSFFCNASTGNLSQAQIDSANADAERQVRAASAGQQPAVVESLVAQVKKEINSVLTTFSLPGESATSIGATPGQATTRIAGTNITLGSVTDFINTYRPYVVWGAVAVSALLVFPYVAPSLAKSIKAGRLLRAA